jgi:hypothetical protein
MLGEQCELCRNGGLELNLGSVAIWAREEEGTQLGRSP